VADVGLAGKLFLSDQHRDLASQVEPALILVRVQRVQCRGVESIEDDAVDRVVG